MRLVGIYRRGVAEAIWIRTTEEDANNFLESWAYGSTRKLAVGKLVVDRICIEAIKIEED